MSSNARVTVVVVDDHPVYREGVVRGLSLSGQIEVVAEADNGFAGLVAIRTHEPDVALLDHSIGQLTGIDVVRAIVRDQLRTRTIVLSAFTDSSFVFSALEEGAVGYLAKDSSRAEIVSAVLKVAAGQKVVPADLAGGLADEIRLRSHNGNVVLTERERVSDRAAAVAEAMRRGLVE